MCTEFLHYKVILNNKCLTDVNITSSRINFVGFITCGQLRNVAFAPICAQPCNETNYFNVHVCCFCADMTYQCVCVSVCVCVCVPK